MKLPKFFKKSHFDFIYILIISLIVIGMVSLAFNYIGQFLSLGRDDIQNWFMSARNTPWAFFLVAGVFLGLSFLAAPQFILILSCVFVFGSVQGGVYAFLASLIVASLHFMLARWTGFQYVHKKWGEKFELLSHYIGNKGFWVSLIVRLVPSAPFIVVNAVAGISHIRFLAFISGTALGILPKILFISILGASLENLMKHSLAGFVLLLLLAVLWLGMIFLIRGFVKKQTLKK